MDSIEIYVLLLGIIIAVGTLFSKLLAPTSLLLVIAGMLISLIPHFPQITLNPNVVLNIILPLLIYGTSAKSSWRDVKINLRQIGSLSIGHVVFITVLVATVIHTLIPEMGWPMAFVLGSVISPPDDVAIISIAEKIRMPYRLITILKGESLLNDATALILFRFSLAALITHEFNPAIAMGTFFAVIIGETLYGLALGYLIGTLRLRIKDPALQIMFSLLTPFLAYLPAVQLGGCGVLATVVTGFVIGHVFLERFSAEVRLIGDSVWGSLGFALQSLLFLLVGLDMRYIMNRISSIPLTLLLTYSIAVIFTVILGRFIWVFASIFLTRVLFPQVRKKEPYPAWQYQFIVSWAGMRGGISLAAALAVPMLPITASGINPKDLLLFLVFSVIAATLLFQGLTLPWILDKLKMGANEKKEKYQQHLTELDAKLKMAKAAHRWLKNYKQDTNDDPTLLDEVKLHTEKYNRIILHLQTIIKNHDDIDEHNEALEFNNSILISSRIVETQKEELLRLWHAEKIDYTIKVKLLRQLDHRARQFS